ncbi:MAG: FapA family protein [Ruminococcus sp.]|nr:FapA family protein [Ruminococcus sp.]
MKTEKKRSFKGAVLLTVVSVMSLLIVFLTSTLVLATAANNRAHKSYSSSQANYTARTAIDSILAAAAKDENFASALAGITSSGGGFDIDVTMESTSAGMGRVEKARVEYVGSQPYYNVTESKWEDKDLISISADVVYGGETKTVTAYVLKNPPTGINPGGGGGFVTLGDAGIANHTNSMGGTYLGVGGGSGSRIYQNSPWGPVDLENKLYLNFEDGVDFTTLPVDENGIPVCSPEDNYNLIKSYYTGNDQTIEAPFVVNGNLIVNTQTQVTFPTKGSGMAVWGNMDVQNSSFLLYSETVNNTTAVQFNQEIKMFKDIPYLFVDSQLKFNNQTIGDANLPLNIFCGSMNAQQNGVNLYANVYCQDSDKTSIIGNTNTALNAWSNSVLNGTDSFLGSCSSGNFYSKGNVIINGNGADISGDLVVEGDLTIRGNLTTGGSIVVKGNLKVESGTMNAGNGFYAGYAEGIDITNEGAVPKMTIDGTQELYERIDDITYCVLAKDVNVPQSWGGNQHYDYAWLKPDAIGLYGLTDSDGDGIVDGNVVDFGGGVIDAGLFVNEEYYIPNPDTITKEFSVDTKWVNREDGTETTDINDTLESSGVFKYKGSVIGTPDLYADTHGHELFPKKAEKAVILGLEEIGDGTSLEDSQVIKTIDDIERDYNFTSTDRYQTSIPDDYLYDVESNVYSAWDVPDEITGSCTLEGGGFNKTIYVKGSSSPIYIKLKNFGMEAKDFDDYGIFYDDSVANCGKLIIFIEGSASLNKGKIITKSYYDLIQSGQQFQVATNDDLFVSGITKAGSPKITIQAEPEQTDGSGNVIYRPELSLYNNSMVTANIEAPSLKFYLATASSVPGMIYNGIETNTKPGGLDNVGVIGVLNVAEAEGQNNWTFYYTPDTSGTPPITPPGGGDNSYVITYYEGF